VLGARAVRHWPGRGRERPPVGRRGRPAGAPIASKKRATTSSGGAAAGGWSTGSPGLSRLRSSVAGCLGTRRRWAEQADTLWELGAARGMDQRFHVFEVALQGVPAGRG
jgi:hypothetical protein